ncbi:hypothetical protein M8C21_010938 [Ambrosia artemisiifolia]|uniref:Uncharacterized protein n=1 Tax=Ambrosia artemisiifolia TaxID=4212 RepID=A0AAD5BM43_AMBAR|nr:hypothetical protein M8C21_010938 [Ambrosia artemisiifolia]
MSRVSKSKSFMSVFLDIISKLDNVESVSIIHEDPYSVMLPGLEGDDITLQNRFVQEWVPMVSKSLQSLCLSGFPYSFVVQLISKHCHNLVNLHLTYAWLSVVTMNPMPMLTSLTLEYTDLEDIHLNELNKGFPNLQVLNLIGVRGLQNPKIHLLNLQTCHWAEHHHHPQSSLTLITPNLTTLVIECVYPAEIHVEAPMLSDFQLSINTVKHPGALIVKKFENLKTVWLDSLCIGSLLSEFPITKTVETLSLDSENEEPSDATDSKFTIGKVLMVFPNLSSLCIYSGAWSELEACLNSEDRESSDGKKGLKTICAYLKLVDPSLTFSSVSHVLDQCLGLSEVSLLIHVDVADTESKSFMSKCMARWPGLKWKWGRWSDDMEESWITDGMSN